MNSLPSTKHAGRCALLPASIGAVQALATAVLLCGSAASWGQPAAPLIAPRPYVEFDGSRLDLDAPAAEILNPQGGRQWAIALGKALFWDQQIGSDGQACASCHFAAGADTRKTNVFNPGFLKRPGEDRSFGTMTQLDGEPLPTPGGTGKTGSMIAGLQSKLTIDSAYELKPEDFPLYRLTDYNDSNSPIAFATDDSVSSPGAFDARFFRLAGLGRIAKRERCSKASADLFHVGKLAARQVPPRNTQTTVNAIFNQFSFWDGRANRVFNGVGVFGPRDVHPDNGDPTKRLIVPGAKGKPQLGWIEIHNASLASQAVGPVLSEVEMACDGREFADVARKVLAQQPLAGQTVHREDSVLGVPQPALGNVVLRSPSGRGLHAQYRYAELVRKAFHPKYWATPGRWVIDVKADGKTPVLRPSLLKGHTAMEHNFTMFWGISVMMYQSTLVSDHTRFDACNPLTPVNAATVANGSAGTCRNTESPPVWTESERRGFILFNAGAGNNPVPLLDSQGQPITRAAPACSLCHAGAVTSEAQFQASLADPFTPLQTNLVTPFVPVERSRIDHKGPGTPTVIEGAVHDRGFFNIGVSPSSFDIGNGGHDDYGNPLSMARMYLEEQAGRPAVDPTRIATDRCNTPSLIEPGGTPQFPGCPGTAPPLLDASLEREMVDGGFKTPTIRNVGLTPPYFHNGSYATLRQVVEFYNRGGNQRRKSFVDPTYTGDTSGTGSMGKTPVANPEQRGPDFGSNIDRFMRPLQLTSQEIDDLTAFMLTMTDERVRCDQAPFDHPSLLIAGRPLDRDRPRDGRADDEWFELPATGASGFLQASGMCLPNAGDLFAPGMQSRSGGR